MSITLPSPATTQAPSPCFPWCDHGDRFPGGHESAPAALHPPAGLQSDFPALITALIYTSDEVDRTWVSVRSNGNGTLLDADEADEFADDLIRLALAMRGMGRRVRRSSVVRSVNHSTS